ncbi:MAG: MerR family DNA-binding transcriptional regulator [Candidatus Omnitrophica bacterium]|nr:MerR family DNA-binding transcriptional regulator [Candidatus Omnitrophota bacterium]
MKFYKIRDAVKLIKIKYPNVNASTLRFYTKIGKIPDVERAKGNHRIYTESDIARIIVELDKKFIFEELDKLEKRLINEVSISILEILAKVQTPA